MNPLECTVIVPSHNRRASLARVLEGLRRQTLEAQRYEVIVVLDGCSDDTPSMLESWAREGHLTHLRWTEQPRSGQSAARTVGARMARAEILVFLDDDVIPVPGLLEAHLSRHRAEPAVSVLGDAPIDLGERPSYYDIAVWTWWQELFHRRSLPEHVSSYRDFCAGNVSMRKADFFRAGGFDPEFRGYGGEDFDLGYRLQKAGIELVAEPRALGWHRHTTRPSRVLRNTREEGLNDVRLGRKHPELIRGLRLAHPSDGRALILLRFSFALPTVADAAAALLSLALRVCRALRLRATWLKLFKRLRDYAYWRGVREALPTWDHVMRFKRQAPPAPTAVLDVSDGLPSRLPPVSGDGPTELQVMAEGRELGRVTVDGWAATSLRRSLADRLTDELGPSLWLLLVRHHRRSEHSPSLPGR